jgi:nucleoside-diphosphate-sugar epimerase
MMAALEKSEQDPVSAMKTVLVTGGAGFIGSHTCKALAARGLLPVAFDDLSKGHAEFAIAPAPSSILPR